MAHHIQELVVMGLKLPGHRMVAAKHLQYLFTGKRSKNKKRKSPFREFFGGAFLNTTSIIPLPDDLPVFFIPVYRNNQNVYPSWKCLHLIKVIGIRIIDNLFSKFQNGAATLIFRNYCRSLVMQCRDTSCKCEGEQEW